MKIYSEYSDDGCLHSFEVSGFFMTRKKVVNRFGAIAGVKILRKPLKYFSWFREEVFCEFQFKGKKFQIEELFGDNSRYWVGSKEKNNGCLLQEIIDSLQI